MFLNSMAKYTVVQFPVDGSVAVIATNWLYMSDQGQLGCYYPGRKCGNARKLVQSCATPNATTWDMFDCRNLYQSGTGWYF